jgi:hypothetical protein
MTCEPGDLFEVRSLGQRCEIADSHVLDHTKAKWGHDQLPCETNSATWRRLIVSRVRCQTRGIRLPRSGLVQGSIRLGRSAGSPAQGVREEAGAHTAPFPRDRVG